MCQRPRNHGRDFPASARPCRGLRAACEDEPMMSKSTTRPAIDLNRNLLGSGLLLLVVGGVLWLTGAVVSATALTQAAKKWIAQWEESPSEIAHRRIHQMRIAAEAGS